MAFSINVELQLHISISNIISKLIIVSCYFIFPNISLNYRANKININITYEQFIIYSLDYLNGTSFWIRMFYLTFDMEIFHVNIAYKNIRLHLMTG